MFFEAHYNGTFMNWDFFVLWKAEFKEQQQNLPRTQKTWLLGPALLPPRIMTL